MVGVIGSNQTVSLHPSQNFSRQTENRNPSHYSSFTSRSLEGQSLAGATLQKAETRNMKGEVFRMTLKDGHGYKLRNVIEGRDLRCLEVRKTADGGHTFMVVTPDNRQTVAISMADIASF